MVHPNSLALDSPDFLPYVLARMIQQQHQLPDVYNHPLLAQQLQLQQYQQQQQQHQQLLYQLHLQSIQQQLQLTLQQQAHAQPQQIQQHQPGPPTAPAQLHQPAHLPGRQQHLEHAGSKSNPSGLGNSGINSVKNLNNQYKSSIFESIAALTSSNQQRRSSSQASSVVSQQPHSHRQTNQSKEAHQIERLLSASPPPAPVAKKPRGELAGESSNASRRLTSFVDCTKFSPNQHDHQSAAINSLSNFVTDALAPILNEGGDKSHAPHTYHNQQQQQQQGKHFGSASKLGNTATSSLNPDFLSATTTTTTTTSTRNKSPLSGGKQLHFNNGNGIRNIINQYRKSSSMESEGCELGDERAANNNDPINTTNNKQHNCLNNKQEQNRSSTLDLISSAAQSLKSSAVAGSTTINTTLAKAPPELVKKQPAWVFCTRYSDRPSSGPRTRRAKAKLDKKAKDPKASTDEKRPRTAFTSEQLDKLRQEFQENSYLDEKRRKDLAERLCLNENQIKIWFQNKRAKIKKQNNQPNPLRGLLVAGGLYNHSTATSDCSESYANGNDHEDPDEDDRNDDCMDSNDLDDI